MDRKYLKYKTKYLKLKGGYHHHQKGGFIDELTKPVDLINKYRISKVISGDNVDCKFIDSVEWLPNAGTHNLGIGFLNDGDKKIFLKSGTRGCN